MTETKLEKQTKTLKPLFEEVARERGSLVLSLYFDQRCCRQEDLLANQQRLQQQMGSYQHQGIVQMRVNAEGTELVLNSPEYVDAILKDVSHKYKGMVYDVFLADDSGQRVGRAWALYDFLRKVDEIEGLGIFYEEIAKSPLVPKKLQPKLVRAVREAGVVELKKRGLDKMVAEWKAIAV